MIEYKGYKGVVEFDSEMRIFTGHVVDLRDEIYFEGESVESLEASMQRAVDHYLAVCDARGDEPERPFSGKLNVRLGAELHRAAALAAAAEGESLNNWLVRVVENAARARKESRHRHNPNRSPPQRPAPRSRRASGK